MNISCRNHGAVMDHITNDPQCSSMQSVTSHTILTILPSVVCLWGIPKSCEDFNQKLQQVNMIQRLGGMVGAKLHLSSTPQDQTNQAKLKILWFQAIYSEAAAHLQ